MLGTGPTEVVELYEPLEIVVICLNPLKPNHSVFFTENIVVWAIEDKVMSIYKYLLIVF